MSGMSRAELLDCIESIRAERDQARARIAELERPIDMDEIQLALGNYSIYARPEDGMRNALAWFIRNRAALKPAEPPTEGS